MLIIHILATLNNTIFTISSLKGDTLFWKGSKSMSVDLVTQQISQNLKKLNCSEVHIKLSGIGPGRVTSIKGLKKYGVRIISLQDVTPIPHNGCRPQKKRRL